jgi:hypothetical protein
MSKTITITLHEDGPTAKDLEDFVEIWRAPHSTWRRSAIEAMTKRIMTKQSR